MKNYIFKGFRLEYSAETGDCFTIYEDGAKSERPLVPEDAEHAEALGITPQEHALLHELTHHLLAIEEGRWTCPIVLNDALGLDGLKDLNGGPLTKPWEIREWKITALTYFLMRKPMRAPEDWGAIMDLEKEGINPYNLADKIVHLYRKRKWPSNTYGETHPMYTVSNILR